MDDPLAPPDCILTNAPIIILPPLSQAVVSGASLSLSVAVTNTASLPITYRWQCNGEDIPGGTVVLADWLSFFTITNAQSPSTNYTIHVSNAACPGGFTSAAAHLAFDVDTDDDRMPDAWETTHGLDPGDVSDHALDADGDGMSNWSEYTAGTNPADAASLLEIESIGIAEDASAALTFTARSNKTYAVEYSDALGAGGWSRLADICAQPSDREETLHDPGFRANRYYRLVTPRP